MSRGMVGALINRAAPIQKAIRPLAAAGPVAGEENLKSTLGRFSDSYKRKCLARHPPSWKGRDALPVPPGESPRRAGGQRSVGVLVL
jgi:hypothetical protein